MCYRYLAPPAAPVVFAGLLVELLDDCWRVEAIPASVWSGLSSEGNWLWLVSPWILKLCRWSMVESFSLTIDCLSLTLIVSSWLIWNRLRLVSTSELLTSSISTPGWFHCVLRAKKEMICRRFNVRNALTFDFECYVWGDIQIYIVYLQTWLT